MSGIFGRMIFMIVKSKKEKKKQRSGRNIQEVHKQNSKCNGEKTETRHKKHTRSKHEYNIYTHPGDLISTILPNRSTTILSP
jgi:hypothetical protein